MKGSLIVILFFCIGCVMGAFNKFQFDTHTVSMYILYALMLQVGISIGSNKNLKAIVSHLHPKMLYLRTPLRAHHSQSFYSDVRTEFRCTVLTFTASTPKV